jgi:hypothetical protein
MKRLILLVVAAIACGEPEPETFDPCMPNAQNKTLRLYGPWGGLQDHETDTTSVDFARSFNVEVDGREIRSRRGRVPFHPSGSPDSRCARVISHSVVGSPDFTAGIYRYDSTEPVSDGLSSTALVFADPAYFGAAPGMYVGFPAKFGAVKFTFKTASTNPAATLAVKYRGAAGTFQALTVTDGTSLLTVDGAISWEPPADWRIGFGPDSVPGTGVEFEENLYWVFFNGLNFTKTEIAEIRVEMVGVPGPTSMVDTASGLLVAGNNSVALYAPIAPSMLGAPEGGLWHWVEWGRDLLGANGGAPVVLKENGPLEPLKAVPGQDSATTGYLSSLPNAQALAVYRGRLYLAYGKTVIFSELNNALNIIPYDGSAPQRGANVWPRGNDFDVSGEIVGFAVFGDRLVIATDVGLDVWDGHSRQSVPGAPGCVAGHTIAETRKGLAYLALDGVYLFNGASARHISGGVSETLERVSKNAVHGAVGVAYPAARQYRLYVPVNGSARNTLCLAWNYEDDRWFPLGGTPPWLDADERYREMEVAAACVANVGADGEVLLTADYDGNVWVEDRGFTDGGYTVSWVLAFKRLGLGEDEGMRTWRNVRISAKATGAPIKLAMLPDGDDLETSVLAGTETGMPVAGAVATLTEGQATWMMDAPGPEPLPDEMSLDLAGAVERDASGGSSPTSVWRSFPVSHARVTRTIQPVLYCDGVDSAGARRGTKAAVRGIEVDYRIRTGRRSLA